MYFKTSEKDSVRSQKRDTAIMGEGVSYHHPHMLLPMAFTQGLSLSLPRQMEYFNGASVNQSHGGHHGHNLANGNQLYNQVSFGNPSPPGAWPTHNILSSGPESPENQTQNSPHLSMLQASQITNFSNSGNAYFAPEKYGINMV